MKTEQQIADLLKAFEESLTELLEAAQLSSNAEVAETAAQRIREQADQITRVAMGELDS